MTPPRAAKISGVAKRSIAAASADQTTTRSRFASPDRVAAIAPIAQRAPVTDRRPAEPPLPLARPPTRRGRSRPPSSTSDGTGERTSTGGSASQNARRPSTTAAQPASTGRSTLARLQTAGERRGAHGPRRPHGRVRRGRSLYIAVTITGAETSRTIRPWMISVRFVASSGGKTSGSRLRTDVPLMQRAEQQGGEQDAARGVAPQQRDRDADEAGADDARVLDVVGGDRELPAEDVDRAREPRERAAHEHHLRVGPAGVDAAVLGGVGVEADGARLVARDRAVQQHPEHDERRERDEDPDVQALQLRVAPEHVQPRVRDDGVGDRDGLVRGGVGVQRAAEAERPHADPQRDVVEHDRRDHLVGAGRRLEEARDAAPDRARERPEHEREEDVQPAGQSVRASSPPRRRCRARRSTGPGRRC